MSNDSDQPQDGGERYEVTVAHTSITNEKITGVMETATGKHLDAEEIVEALNVRAPAAAASCCTHCSTCGSDHGYTADAACPGFVAQHGVAPAPSDSIDAMIAWLQEAIDDNPYGLMTPITVQANVESAVKVYRAALAAATGEGA
jgi:hypothetical protein